MVPRNDIIRDGNKMFISTPPPHPSLRDTFSPRAKALTAVQTDLFSCRIATSAEVGTLEVH